MRVHVIATRKAATSQMAVGAALVALTILGTACWETHSYSPVADETIEIGALVSLTGAEAGAGYVHLAAMECAVEDANNELASQDIAVNLQLGDTRSDPYAASVLLNSFLLQNVRVAVGPYTSMQVAAVEPNIRASQSLLISPASTALDLANRHDHVYRLAPNDTHMASSLVNLMWNRGHRALALVHRNDPWGYSVSSEVERLFTARGGVVVSAHAYGWFDYSEAAEFLRELHADMTAAMGDFTETEIAVQLTGMWEALEVFRVANDSVPDLRNFNWYGSDGYVNNWSLFHEPEIADFAADVEYTAPSYRIEVPDEYWGVVEAIELRTGATPGPYSLLSYDAVRIAARTIAQVGTHATYQELENALEDVVADYEGVSGRIFLDPMGDRNGGWYDFFSVRNDGWTYRWVRVRPVR